MTSVKGSLDDEAGYTDAVPERRVSLCVKPSTAPPLSVVTSGECAAGALATIADRIMRQANQLDAIGLLRMAADLRATGRELIRISEAIPSERPGRSPRDR